MKPRTLFCCLGHGMLVFDGRSATRRWPQRADLADKARAAGRDSSDDVTVTVGVLSCAVDDDVDANRRGAEVDGRRERTVDDGCQLVSLGESHHASQVPNLEYWIRYALHIEHLQCTTAVLLT